MYYNFSYSLSYFFLFLILNIGQHVTCIFDTSHGNARTSATRSPESSVIQAAYILTLHVSLNSDRETEIWSSRFQYILRFHKRGFSYMFIAIIYISHGIRYFAIQGKILLKGKADLSFSKHVYRFFFNVLISFLNCKSIKLIFLRIENYDIFIFSLNIH
jgi:hypothetical protein